MELKLTQKEIKLIKKALLNCKKGKSEEEIWYSIQNKLEVYIENKNTK